MQEFLDQFFGDIVAGRADQTWIPSLHARPEVVAAFPVVGGFTLIEDKGCGANTIELRAETGELMASYVGVPLAAAPPEPEPKPADPWPTEEDLTLPSFLDRNVV